MHRKLVRKLPANWQAARLVGLPGASRGGGRVDVGQSQA